jgi:DNA-binding response OmpR family regulator
MDKNNIMLVDDNRDLVTVVKVALENKGYSVQSAYNASELFARLKEYKPDLIVLDVMMPQMDGLEVLKRLKFAEDTSAIPVILLTAKFQYEDILNAYQLGADVYITKPFTSSQLLAEIKRVLNGQNSRPSQL